eukprot:3507832-Rhodomonas_salina.2
MAAARPLISPIPRLLAQTLAFSAETLTRWAEPQARKDTPDKMREAKHELDGNARARDPEEGGDPPHSNLPVKSATCLGACYAMSSTDGAYAATSGLDVLHAVPFDGNHTDMDRRCGCFGVGIVIAQLRLLCDVPSEARITVRWYR